MTKTGRLERELEELKKSLSNSTTNSTNNEELKKEINKLKEEINLLRTEMDAKIDALYKKSQTKVVNKRYVKEEDITIQAKDGDIVAE